MNSIRSASRPMWELLQFKRHKIFIRCRRAKDPICLISNLWQKQSMKCHKSMNSSIRCKSIHRNVRHFHINCIRIFHFVLYTATRTVLIQHITMAPVIMISSISASVVSYSFIYIFFFGRIEIKIWFAMEKMAHENSMMFLNHHEFLGCQAIIGFSMFYCFIYLLFFFCLDNQYLCKGKNWRFQNNQHIVAKNCLRMLFTSFFMRLISV